MVKCKAQIVAAAAKCEQSIYSSTNCSSQNTKLPLRMANKTNAELSANFISLPNFCLCSRWIIGGVNCQWPFQFCSFFSLFILYIFFFGNLRPRPGILGISTAICSTIPTLTSNFKFQDSGRLWMQMLMMHFLSVGCRNCWEQQIGNGSYKMHIHIPVLIHIGCAARTYISDLYYLSCKLIE